MTKEARMFEALPGYDHLQSYDWNYANAPGPVEVEVPAVRGEWDYCGLPTESPLGMAAGPLLNGKWILYYASLGFDVLTYKTVRSAARACYPMPNLQPVDGSPGGDSFVAAPEMTGSWAVSFGMPSKAPEVWRADVERTRELLPRNKVLSVSVVASPQPGWSLARVAGDYALCAKWAIESGADCIEANFSCPNVRSADGQLYHQPEWAGVVGGHLREAAGRAPLLIKIGQVTSEKLAAELMAALAPHVNALVMVNCLAAKVTGSTGENLFDGEKRGIAGPAIREPVFDQLRLFGRLNAGQGSRLELIGVGGIQTAADVRAHLDVGCRFVQLATAAMVNPRVGLEIRRELSA